MLFISDSKTFDLDYEQAAEFLEIMVQDITLEFDVSVDIAITLISHFYDMKENKIRTMLKYIKSPFVGNNNIVYFDENKPVKRTNAWAKVIRVMTKISKKLKRIDKNFPCDSIIETIKEDYAKAYVLVG